jgi:hypothetical protein
VCVGPDEVLVDPEDLRGLARLSYHRGFGGEVFLPDGLPAEFDAEGGWPW